MGKSGQSGTSAFENRWAEVIEGACNCKIIRNDREAIHGRELDIYIPEKKLAFEFNGIYWHQVGAKTAWYHFYKTRDCMKAGIRLVHVWEYEDSREAAIRNLICMVLKIGSKEEPDSVEMCSWKEVDTIVKTYYFGEDIKSTEKILVCVRKGNEAVGALVCTEEAEGNLGIHGFCYDSSKVDGESALYEALEVVRKEYPRHSMSVRVDIGKFTGETYEKLGFRRGLFIEPKKIAVTMTGGMFELMDSGRITYELEAGQRLIKGTHKNVVESGGGNHSTAVSVMATRVAEADEVALPLAGITVNGLLSWPKRFRGGRCTRILDQSTGGIVVYHPFDAGASKHDREVEVRRYIDLGEIRPEHIFQHELLDYNKAAVIAMLLAGRGMQKLSLKASDIRLMDSPSECCAFVNKYYPGGAARGAKCSYICVHAEYGIVGAVQAGYDRYGRNHDVLEIYRTIWRPDVEVTGGTLGVIRMLAKIMGPSGIVTYTSVAKPGWDRVYAEARMKRSDYPSEPGYVWCNGYKVLSRIECQKKKLLAKGLGTPYMTEAEIMESIGYKRVYDYGNWKWSLGI